jgi:hypothetical protein
MVSRSEELVTGSTIVALEGLVIDYSEGPRDIDLPAVVEFWWGGGYV